MPEDFAIRRGLDAAPLAERFAASGRVHVPDFLEAAGAERLLAHLKGRDDWRLVINQDDKTFELDRKAQAALSQDDAARLDAAVQAGARRGFQFRYETIRVPDAAEARKADPSLLNLFADWLSAPATLKRLHAITGFPRIDFLDAQATAYGPGHFLTAHDDDVAGKNRLAAYVFNLTAEWRADWGGLLAFHGADGNVEEAFAPRFNALNIFAVPKPHSVSYVVPYVPHRRYSVTGWMRLSG